MEAADAKAEGLPVLGSSPAPPRASEAAMKPLTILGVVLIVLGVLALAYQRITYTTRETVLDVGPIEATAERQKTIPLPPVLGAAAIAAGAIVLVVGSRRRS